MNRNLENIVKQEYAIKKRDRNKLNNHRSFVIWFTGLSGSGKSTIANALEKNLFNKGIRTYTLDGDNIRGGLNKGLGFSEEDRHENIRRIAEVGKLFIDAGVVALTAFISPLKKDRDLAREIIGEGNFLEVYINTPLDICEKRDVKGLYKKARAGEIKNFTGLDSPYEAPVEAELEIVTVNKSIEESVEEIYSYLLEKLKLI